MEKSAVELAGYGKTALLQSGDSETVTVTFTKNQLKAYDNPLWDGAGAYRQRGQ